MPMALTLGVFTVSVLLTRIVSIGSILAGLALPIFIWWLQPERALLISVGAAAALVILRHQENLRRLVRGSEKAIAPGSGGRG